MRRDRHRRQHDQFVSAPFDAAPDLMQQATFAHAGFALDADNEIMRAENMKHAGLLLKVQRFIMNSPCRIADKDKDGRKHAQIVAGKLHGVAKSVRVIELPDTNGKPVKDAHDFFAAGGNTAQIFEIVGIAPMWTPQAAPLKSVAGSIAPKASASPEIIVLPSGAVSISESARVIFQRIAPMRTLFWRGGVLVELVAVDGVQGLEVLKPEKFRSDVEKIGQLYAYRAAGKGEPALKPSKMSLDDAKAILAASESRAFLPSIASVLRCPVLIESKTGGIDILGKGYHAELGGLLIVNGDTPPPVPLAEAIASLRWIVEEFDFQTESDRSRALAAFITPALRFGGFIPGYPARTLRRCDESHSTKVA